MFSLSFFFLPSFLKRFLQVFTDGANSAASWIKSPFPPALASSLASVAPRHRHTGPQTGAVDTPSGPQSQVSKLLLQKEGSDGTRRALPKDKPIQLCYMLHFVGDVVV
jgi:hypothetical protein